MRSKLMLMLLEDFEIYLKDNNFSQNIFRYTHKFGDEIFNYIRTNKIYDATKGNFSFVAKLSSSTHFFLIIT